MHTVHHKMFWQKNKQTVTTYIDDNDYKGKGVAILESCDYFSK